MSISMDQPVGIPSNEWKNWTVWSKVAFAVKEGDKAKETSRLAIGLTVVYPSEKKTVTRTPELV